MGALRTMQRKIGREQNRELRNMISTMRVNRTIKEVDAAWKEVSILRSAERVAAGVSGGVVLLAVIGAVCILAGVI